MYTYHWKHYNQLTKEELHQIFILRQQVFVVEQNCVYLDADEHDQHSFHLFAINDSGESSYIAAYLRVITPTENYTKYSIGRVLTKKNDRGNGLAREIMLQAMKKLREEPACSEIHIAAQLYLENFYKNLGFTTISKPYDEDGILHIDMVNSLS